jgi:tetratricopeptide (TPR) repeat protein
MRLAIVFPLTVAIASGAAVFKGKVVRNEVGGAPIAGANIRAPGANPTVSRSPHGDFVLEFPSKNRGDRLTLSVAMTGMVVVNWVQLDVTLPADADANELNVILAREAEQEEMARRFFRLASTKAIEESYKREIEEGKRDREQLRRERDEAKVAADKAAEELAKLRPGESSAVYEEAMRLFAGGKIDEALQALSEAKLRRLSEEAQERKEQAEKQLAEATRGWLLRGKLLTSKLQFADAEKAYGEAVKTSPGDFDACFQQAHFLDVLNRYSPAVKGYVRCLALARSKADPDSVAGTLNNLGILHREQNRMEEARKAFEEALDTYRRLARAHPDTYLPDVAMTLNNLGNLHRDQNRMQEARKAFEEALDTYRRLARANSGTYLPDVAGTLNSLGILHSDQNRMEEARKAYEEALDTYRRLADANPDAHLPDLARVLWSIGKMHIALHQDSEARQALKESLGIFQNFAAKDRAQYQRFVDLVNADLSKVTK